MTSLSFRTAFLYVLLAAFLASARAQSAIPRCKLNSACSALFEQGKAQSGAKNLDEAYRLYKLAYEVEPDPDLLFSIARILHKKGNNDDAVSYYQRFLASASPAVEERHRAQDYLNQLQLAGSIVSQGTAELTSAGSAQAGRAVHDAQPVYKKWWFWTILGTVAAAGIAGGVAGGVIASRQCQPPSCFVFNGNQ